jgi:hypothetical protein
MSNENISTSLPVVQVEAVKPDLYTVIMGFGATDTAKMLLEEEEKDLKAADNGKQRKNGVNPSLIDKLAGIFASCTAADEESKLKAFTALYAKIGMGFGSAIVKAMTNPTQSAELTWKDLETAGAVNVDTSKRTQPLEAWSLSGIREIEEEKSVDVALAPGNVFYDAQDDCWWKKKTNGEWPASGISTSAFNQFLLTMGVGSKQFEFKKSKCEIVYDKRPLFTQTPGIIVEYEGQATFNTYRPSTVTPIGGNMDIYGELVLHLAGEEDFEGRDFIYQWLAFGYQPIAKGLAPKMPGSALILYGNEGGGKGLLYQTMQALYGEHNCIKIGQGSIDGKHNAEVVNKLLVYANEIMDNPKYGKEALNKIKPWITDPEIAVEGKFETTRNYKNYMSMIIDSNEDNPMIVTEDSRRFSIFKSGKIDTRLSDKIVADLNGDRSKLAAFAHFLKELSVTIRFSQPFKTAARAEVALAYTPPEELFLKEIQQDGWLAVSWAWVSNGNPTKPRESFIGTYILSSTFSDVFQDWCARNRRSYTGPTKLQRLVKKFFPMSGTTTFTHASTKLRGYPGGESMGMIPFHTGEIVKAAMKSVASA